MTASRKWREISWTESAGEMVRGFGCFALRAVGEPPVKDFEPGRATIGLKLLAHVSVKAPGAEKGRKGGR